MAFIYNNQEKNHYTLINELMKKSSKAIIVAPFIQDIISECIKRNNNLKELIIITNLDKENGDTAQKLILFYELIKANKNIKISIKNDKNLHGKVYSFFDKDRMIGTILTSANFTSNGLIKRNEYGILIENEVEQKKLVGDILKRPYENISYEMINAVYNEAKEYLKGNKPKKEQGFDIHDYIEETFEIVEMKNNKLRLIDQLNHPRVSDEYKSTYHRIKVALDNLLLKNNPNVYSVMNYDYYAYKIKGKPKNRNNIVAISLNSNGVYVNFGVDPSTIQAKPHQIYHRKSLKTGKSTSFWGYVSFHIINKYGKHFELIDEVLEHAKRIYEEKLDMC